MTVDFFARGGVDEVVSEKAERAVKAFRNLQPTLTAYARVLTGRRDVRVEMAARDNGSTDGRRIYFRPPLALGDKTPHERPLCDKRNEYGIMQCPACAIREEVLTTIYHEIAHICFESFAQTTDEDKKKAIAFAIRETKGKWAEEIAKRVESAPAYKTRDYINLASLINEYLPFLLNALEDARVNRELFKARPGVKRMFDADTARIFREGFEARNPDGSFRTVRWQEAPMNSQAMIGTFCKASGYNYEGWFHPDVVRDLNDAELTRLINEMDTIRTAGGVYNLSFKVLARLRELGYCGTPQDPDPESEPEPESESESEPDEESEEGDGAEEEDSESGSGSSGEDDSAEESGSPDSDTSSGEPDLSGESDGSDAESDASDDAEDEAGEEGESESAGDESSGSAQEESEGTDGGSDSEGEPRESGDSESGSDPGGLGNGTGEDSDSEQSSLEGSDESSVPTEASESDDGVGDTEPSSGHRDEDSDSDRSGVEEDDSEPIDTGADDGYGGTAVEESEPPRPEMGTPEEVEAFLHKWGDHEEKPKTIEAAKEEKAVDQAIIQGLYFTTPSRRVFGVREHFYGNPVKVNGYDYSLGWNRAHSRRTGVDTDLDIPETVLQPGLIKMRRAFTDNQRGAQLTNRKSGRINAKVLGKRAWSGDDRLFQKNILPGKRDYMVVFGMDISGSTLGVNLALEKRAIMAQATLLDRLGVPFAIYAHSGNYHDAYESGQGLDLEVYHIKDADERWTSETKQRLDEIGSVAANLDGHALEYLRKRADESKATDKIILYYSDGKMPAENHDEELEILTREIDVCRNKGYTLLGVGIRTDSPARHGLETVEVHTDEDLIKVVEQLGRRLSVTGGSR